MFNFLSFMPFISIIHFFEKWLFDNAALQLLTDSPDCGVEVLILSSMEINESVLSKRLIAFCGEEAVPHKTVTLQSHISFQGPGMSCG
jgi:DNA polymerase IIIc chi subunit